VQSGAEVVAQGSGIESGLLFGGIGVDLSTYALYMIDDLASGIVLCTLEDTMLDIVRHTILIGQFVASACTYHYTNIYNWRSGLSVDNLQSIG
jgi:uncharacterized membrane protein